MKHILLVGAIYSDNLGDGAICQTMENLLSKSYQVHLLDIYGRIDYPTPETTKMANIEKYFRNAVVKIGLRKKVLSLGIWPSTFKTKERIQRVGKRVDEILAEQKIDAIVFAGGALLKGIFLNYIEEIQNHNSEHVPVFFNACGVDTEMLPVEWSHLDKILNHTDVKGISLRDGHELLAKKYPKLYFMNTMDPAVCANRIYKNNLSRSNIGLGIMLSHKHKFQQQVFFWKSLIERLNAEKREWMFFTNGSPEDYNFAIYILNLMGESREHLVDRPTEPSELYTLISGFEMVISMRLHSHILAYSSDTPSIGISWDKKVDAFFQKVGKAVDCFDLSASADDVFSRITAIEKEPLCYENHKEIERMVDGNVSALIQKIG